jgi:dolichol-phosphate mannosyltransferase
MNVLIVLPTYNERENLAELVRVVLVDPANRVMVVDDGSPDGTGAIADDLATQHPGRVEVVHRTGRRGLGRSYVDGLQRALAEGWADLICQMDADWSHDPKFLPAMRAACEEHDVVVGSRYLQGVSVVNWPLRRLILSTFANRYIRAVTGIGIADCTSGYRCWRRAALAAVPLDRVVSDGYAFLVEMIYEAHAHGARIGEVPIVFVERRFGASKLSTGVLLESAITPWRLRLRHLARTLRRPFGNGS